MYGAFPFALVAFENDMRSALLALCEGYPPVTIGFPNKDPVRQSSVVSLNKTSCLTNSRVAFDLGRLIAHVTSLQWQDSILCDMDWNDDICI